MSASDMGLLRFSLPPAKVKRARHLGDTRGYRAQGQLYLTDSFKPSSDPPSSRRSRRRKGERHALSGIRQVVTIAVEGWLLRTPRLGSDASGHHSSTGTLPRGDGSPKVVVVTSAADVTNRLLRIAWSALGEPGRAHGDSARRLTVGARHRSTGKR